MTVEELMACLKTAPPHLPVRCRFNHDIMLIEECGVDGDGKTYELDLEVFSDNVEDWNSL